jgi:hypothetical protein
MKIKNNQIDLIIEYFNPVELGYKLIPGQKFKKNKVYNLNLKAALTRENVELDVKIKYIGAQKDVEGNLVHRAIFLDLTANQLDLLQRIATILIGAKTIEQVILSALLSQKPAKRKGIKNMKLIHICEVCGKQEILDSETAYSQEGWDYPPIMGKFKIVSPRTCGSCPVNLTLWWELTVNKTPVDELPDRHKDTLYRIFHEPDIITPATENSQ